MINRIGYDTPLAKGISDGGGGGGEGEGRKKDEPEEQEERGFESKEIIKRK